MSTLISSQRYLDESIVKRKVEETDFEVLVSPVFQYNGQEFRVMIDGHHSFEAAKRACAMPILKTATFADCDRINLLENGKIEDFLESSWIDSDWYDVITNQNIF